MKEIILQNAPSWITKQLDIMNNIAEKECHRGLFRSRNGVLINADVNGAGNILRKVIPNAYRRDSGVVLHQFLIRFDVFRRKFNKSAYFVS